VFFSTRLFINFDLVTWEKTSGLEIAGCQWPKAGHILEMAGKNKFELSSHKEMADEIL
jgi:hypothetical protein